jgi:hypothetical protein
MILPLRILRVYCNLAIARYLCCWLIKFLDHGDRLSAITAQNNAMGMKNIIYRSIKAYDNSLNYIFAVSTT